MWVGDTQDNGLEAKKAPHFFNYAGKEEKDKKDK